MPNDIYAALKGAGFNSLSMQHVFWPIIAIFIWSCRDFFIFLSCCCICSSSSSCYCCFCIKSAWASKILQ